VSKAKKKIETTIDLRMTKSFLRRDPIVSALNVVERHIRARFAISTPRAKLTTVVHAAK